MKMHFYCFIFLQTWRSKVKFDQIFSNFCCSSAVPAANSSRAKVFAIAPPISVLLFSTVTRKMNERSVVCNVTEGWP